METALDSSFWLNIALAFVVGGFWIAFTTIAAEKHGSKIGGFIGGLPTTVIVSYFFIGLIQSPQIASEATTVFPLTYGFTALFLVTFAILGRGGFLMGLVSALVLWIALSSLVVIFAFENFLYAVILYFIIFIFSYWMLDKYLHLPSLKRPVVHYSIYQVLARGLAGGSAIALTVFITRVAGPIFGGIFAAFPVGFTTTLIIMYRSRGLDFSRSMTKPLLVTGMTTIVVYAMGVRYFYLSNGLYIGTLLSFLVSMIVAYLVYRYVLKRLT